MPSACEPVKKSGAVDFPVATSGEPTQTFYTLIGEPNNTRPTLIALHGGPGVPHNYLLALADLWTQHGIPVLLYDQLGCGRSTHLPSKNGDTSFWTESLFCAELDNLIDKLGLNHDGKQYDLLGHSWGGMLGSTYAARNPKGLRRLVLVSAPSSIEVLLEGIRELKALLPVEVRETIQRCEDSGTTDSDEYRAATGVFYARHYCRLKEWPDDLKESKRMQKEDSSVYRTMYGQSEIFCTGPLGTWSAKDHAQKITQPTLMITGRYDEIVDAACIDYFRLIPKVRWITLSESSHQSLWEERERFMDVISDFLYW